MLVLALLLVADAATLPCASAKVDAATKAGIGAHLVAGPAGETAESSATFAKLSERVAEAATACRRQHGWSSGATEAATSWTMIDAARPALEAALSAKGVDPAALVRALARMSAAERDDLFRGETSAEDAGVTGLLKAAEAEGVLIDESDPSKASLVGIYAATLIGEKKMAADFAAG